MKKRKKEKLNDRLKRLIAIRKFLKRELKELEKLFELHLEILNDRFYNQFEIVDFNNSLNGIRKTRERYWYVFGLLQYINAQIEKQKRKSKKKVAS